MNIVAGSRLLAFGLCLVALGPLGCGVPDCKAVAPKVLPSGAAPGTATEGVSGGAKQVTWGQGRDLVDLRIGLSYYAEGGDALLAETRVRGQRAIVYEIFTIQGWALRGRRKAARTRCSSRRK